MDGQLARAIDMLYRASVERGRQLEEATRLHDLDHAVISNLHDIAVAEHPLRLVPQIEDAAERAEAGLF